MMVQARKAELLRPDPFRPISRLAETWWGGLLIAAGAVAVSLALRTALEGLGRFYYLPMVPAVMVTALLAGRREVLFAVSLSIVVNILLVERENLIDAAANAILFVVVSLGIAEVCRRLIDALERSRDLSRDLAVRETLLDTILGSIPVVTLDRLGNIQRVTPAAADLLGAAAAAEAARGKPFTAFVPDFDVSALAAVEAGGALEPPPAGHWSIRRRDGRTTPLTIHADVLPDDVAPETVVLSLADQGPAEAARERAHELNIQLNNVWRLNSMGELAATLAHELNQPLTAATVYLHAGQSDLSRAGLMGESAARSLDLAKTQLLRAGDIIRRTRELIATGGRSFAEARVSSLIEDLVPVFALISRDMDVPIRVDVHDADDHVLADRIQIQQAVTNLVRNAVDAVADRGDGLVSIVGRTLNGDGYEISVEDNGPGIPEDGRDSIFRPMTTTKAGGMGLGLSVTRSIVESHGGQLAVGRSPLGGAAFSFRLSRVTELEAA